MNEWLFALRQFLYYLVQTLGTEDARLAPSVPRIFDARIVDFASWVARILDVGYFKINCK